LVVRTTPGNWYRPVNSDSRQDAVSFLSCCVCPHALLKKETDNEKV
jgi:hypothetical protein